MEDYDPPLPEEKDEEFVPETEELEEDAVLKEEKPAESVTVEKTAETSDQSAQEQENTTSDPGTEVNPDFDTRYLNNKWIGLFKSSNQYLEHTDSGWQPIAEDELEFIQQLWFEQMAQETKVIDGVKFRWNATKQEWDQELEINEDFIAQYQASYGVQHDYSALDEEVRKRAEAERLKLEKAAEEKEKKKKKKRVGVAPEPEPQGWLDLSDKIHAVYVSKLPLDISDQEFLDFMTKCGIIQPDPRTNKPKIKLYRDDDGSPKGDGRCCYLKKESVDLALNILDGAYLKGKIVKVERAHFEMKGDYDPAKKKRKLTAEQKKQFTEKLSKRLDWRPEKPRNYRPLSDCTVIIKHLFTQEQMLKNVALLLDLKEQVQESCSKYGNVKKVTVYENHPDGVVSVRFETTEESDKAVEMLNGRVVDGRKLEVSLWDGKSKYHVEESEEAKKERLAAWNARIEGEGEDEKEKEEKEEEGKEKEEKEEEKCSNGEEMKDVVRVQESVPVDTASDTDTTGVSPANQKTVDAAE